MHSKEGYTSINALAHHAPLINNSKPINTVAFRKYLSTAPQHSYTLPVSTLNKAQGYNIFTRIDVYNEFKLDRKFGIWNSPIWEISSLIQMAGNHRSTVIIDKVYKVFFHCDDYLQWAHKSDQVLHSTFILPLEV